MRRVLVVDDERNITFVIKAILERGGFEVDVFNSSVEALKRLSEPRVPYCAVVTDLYMPDQDGMAVLAHMKDTHPDIPVVMITAFGTVDSAVQALKKGAFDYITKPFEQGEILAIIEKAANTFQLRNTEPSNESGDSRLSKTLVIGKSPAMQEVVRIVRKVALSPSTVLITGESGTGKELVALEIHRHSERVHQPFIKINCAAVPHHLIESELFGYEKGAFTGAVNSKPGRFELAHEGTLFLDEVAEMPLEMQAKLLRVIQEAEFERVGGLQTIKINVRIVAATNKDLAKEVREGRFRDDLYYRLNVVSLLLPPLRERRVDIEDLVYFFIKKFNDKLGKRIESVDSVCLKTLCSYSWPGNIRQLENVLERAILMSEGSILRSIDLPEEVFRGEASLPASSPAAEAFYDGVPFKDAVRKQTQAIEREIIEKSLLENEGNITRTAERLGLSRKGLQLKLKELGLSSQGPRTSL
ncbi:MAG TPA: sigma-54 dependent transcriptional regulator [Oligoflexia bacterium]|nr:sigma-54 dependent transcriptional regulator [Oligoflexia bacterium]